MLPVDEVRFVVVDDPLESVGIITCLTAAGFAVVGTTSRSADLVELVERHRPALAIVAFGGSRRVDAPAVVADVAVRLGVRVLALAPDDSTVVLAALESGCLGVVPRTATAEELVDAARAVAAGGRHLHHRSLRQWLGMRQEGPPPAEAPVLSARELDVLGLVAEGFSNVRIADRFGISASTVKTHVEHVLRKLQATDRAHAVSIAMRSGLLR